MYTTITIERNIRKKLEIIKRKYRLRNLSDVINFLIENFLNNNNDISLIQEEFAEIKNSIIGKLDYLEEIIRIVLSDIKNNIKEIKEKEKTENDSVNLKEFFAIEVGCLKLFPICFLYLVFTKDIFGQKIEPNNVKSGFMKVFCKDCDKKEECEKSSKLIKIYRKIEENLSSNLELKFINSKDDMWKTYEEKLAEEEKESMKTLLGEMKWK